MMGAVGPLGDRFTLGARTQWSSYSQKTGGVLLRAVDPDEPLGNTQWVDKRRPMSDRPELSRPAGQPAAATA
jgi:hypothetical protein